MSDHKEQDRSHTFTWEDPKPSQRAIRRHSGAELFEKMRLGHVPEPPYAKLLGMELFDSGEGTFSMTMVPREFHYNPMGCVHGGILSTLLDSVMSAAVHTALPPGSGYLTVSINVNFIKPVYEHTGEVLAEGRLVSMKRQIATAEGRIMDMKGDVCATGTAICMVFERPQPKASQEKTEAE
jgi:uncharacterized protein (TIGR00369 family)